LGGEEKYTQCGDFIAVGGTFKEIQEESHIKELKKEGGG